MINFRTGTHNPLTLYVTSEPYNQVTGGRELPGWMRDGEWSIGWLPHEGLAALAVEAWNGFVCQACPWGCSSCSLNRATCECYEHQDNIDEDGRPVEGSTPIASPAAPEACCVDTEQGPDAHGTLLHTLGCRNRCGVDTTWYPPTSPLQGSPYPCGTTAGHEGDHWAPPALRTPLVVADEPVPVPPPVDALLVLLDKWLEEDVDDHTANGWAAIREDIETRARALWAAGVAEGRRQRDAEIHASVFTSARLAAAEAGFGPAPESVTVSYERRASAYEEGIYDAGITEGRRLLDETAATAAVHAYELGVAEGRRLTEDEFDNWRTYQLAKLVYQYFHVDAGDNSDPVDVAISVLEEAIRDHGTDGGRRQATEERTEGERVVAPIVWLEFVVALPPGDTLLGQAGVQAVLDRLGVTKTGDTAVRGAESTPGDWPAGTSFIAYSMPVSHG